MDEEQASGLSCALDMFKEADEVNALISNVGKDGGSRHEADLDRFTYIVNQYREQPHLLDSSLQHFLSSLVTIVRSPETLDKNREQAFELIYALISVRGFKQAVRHLPHEVADLAPVLEILERDVASPGDWKTPYVSLLWLSIIILLPFPMGRLDAGVPGETSVMDRLVTVLKHYLTSHQSTALAAGFLASKFLTRKDVREKHWDSFYQWAVETVKNVKNREFVRLGALRALNQVFKHGQREDLFEVAPGLLREVVNLEFHTQPLALRLMSLKLVQRIGLVFLKPKVAKWRYQRGCRSLMETLGTKTDDTQVNDLAKNDDLSAMDDDEMYEIPDDVEEVIDQLLMGLKDSDSQVRWSSAKGIGRVTGRLPKYFADDVIGSLLDFFSLKESDSAWHGGCLALAELGRRGFLLPSRLPEVVKVVLDALVFDEARGYYSVGINVRDAACYVVWSFARAYDPAELAPFVNDIAARLLVVCCFDKEIKGRVAASAAFQENVGRVGNFPHGIDILTTADFVSVANRKNAFLSISSFIAGFEEYRRPLLEHLITRKVCHWDATVRDLSSKALYSIGKLDIPFLLDVAWPTLIKGLDSTEINVKHGSLLSLGESVRAVAEVSAQNEGSLMDLLGEERVKFLETVVDRLEEKRAYRLMGAVLMREATSAFIQKCSDCYLPLSSTDRKENWLRHLYGNLSQMEEPVRDAAASALSAFCRVYVAGGGWKTCNEILTHCLHQALSAKSLETRMGFFTAIGYFGIEMLPEESLLLVYSSLCTSFAVKEDSQFDPAMTCARRDAVDACRKLIRSIGVPDDHTMKVLFESFVAALKDYSVDKTGDIGSWVRQAAVDAILVLVEYAINHKKLAVATKELGIELLAGLAKQACERIDKLRAKAAANFIKLVQSEFPNLPCADELRKKFPAEAEQDWVLNRIRPEFIELLDYPQFRRSVLSGLVICILDVGQTSSQQATEALLNYLQKEEIAVKIFESLLEIHEQSVSMNDERLNPAIIITWNKLIPSGAFDESIVSQAKCPYGIRLCAALKSSLTGKKIVPVPKIVAGVELWCCLSLFRDEEVKRKALDSIVRYLGHRIPRVRKATADLFYETVVMAEDSVFTDKMEELVSVLVDTVWNLQDDEEVRGKRDRVCELLNVPIPVMVKKRSS